MLEPRECRECAECTELLLREKAALKKERHRREELEVVAAALYLGHDDAKQLFDVYRRVYIQKDGKNWQPDAVMSCAADCVCGKRWYWSRKKEIKRGYGMKRILLTTLILAAVTATAIRAFITNAPSAEKRKL